jgi:hypothetical protein
VIVTRCPNCRHLLLARAGRAFLWSPKGNHIRELRECMVVHCRRCQWSEAGIAINGEFLADDRLLPMPTMSDAIRRLDDEQQQRRVDGDPGE